MLQSVHLLSRVRPFRPHGLQHARPPCPSPAPRAYSNLYPSSWWCHPTISSSVVHFSCLQHFPASGSFPRSQFFTSGDRSIGVSASASVLPMNIQDWVVLGSAAPTSIAAVSNVCLSAPVSTYDTLASPWLMFPTTADFMPCGVTSDLISENSTQQAARTASLPGNSEDAHGWLISTSLELMNCYPWKNPVTR